MSLYNLIISLEDKLEDAYIALIEAEVNGLDTEDYHSIIKDLVAKERNYFVNLSDDDVYSFRREVLKKVNKNKPFLSLGHLIDAKYWRLLYFLDDRYGSDFFTYANILRYDMNQIILAILDLLIDNEYYQDIRSDLIYYKFNLIYTNGESETDFFKLEDVLEISDGIGSGTPREYKIEFKMQDFKNGYADDLIYVDKAILVLEGKELLWNLESLPEDFRDNHHLYVTALISAIEFFARLVLSDEKVCNYLYDDYKRFMEDEFIPCEIKNLVLEIYSFLESIKGRLGYSR